MGDHRIRRNCRLGVRSPKPGNCLGVDPRPLPPGGVSRGGLNPKGRRRCLKSGLAVVLYREHGDVEQGEQLEVWRAFACLVYIQPLFRLSLGATLRSRCNNVADPMASVPVALALDEIGSSR
jgi:hypothetical protein